MTLREWELRESRRFTRITAALAVIAVLQVMAGRWWIVGLAAVLGVLSAVVAALSWGLAQIAEPWQEPDVRRPPRWSLWLDGTSAACFVLWAGAALVDGQYVDAMSGLLAAGVMWAVLRRTREARLLTEPPKTPARLGPPEEQIP